MKSVFHTQVLWILFKSRNEKVIEQSNHITYEEYDVHRSAHRNILL